MNPMHRSNKRRISTAGVGGASLIGGIELQLKFTRLNKRIQNRSLRRAAGKAGRPVVRAMKSISRPISKTVSKAIGIKVKVYRKDFNSIAIIGVRDIESVRRTVKRVGLGGYEYSTVHDPRKTLHLIEGGTSPHTIKIYGRGSAQHPGTKPRPIVQRAYDETKNKAIAIFQETFTQEVLAGARS